VSQPYHHNTPPPGHQPVEAQVKAVLAEADAILGAATDDEWLNEWSEKYGHLSPDDWPYE
jgi:hypothetical protein